MSLHFSGHKDSFMKWQSLSAPLMNGTGERDGACVLPAPCLAGHVVTTLLVWATAGTLCQGKNGGKTLWHSDAAVLCAFGCCFLPASLF